MNTAPAYKPVIKHEIVQVIMPYIILKATDADTGKLLWHEVTHKEPANFEQHARRAFSTEDMARQWIINKLNGKSKKENA